MKEVQISLADEAEIPDFPTRLKIMNGMPGIGDYKSFDLRTLTGVVLVRDEDAAGVIERIRELSNGVLTAVEHVDQKPSDEIPEETEMKEALLEAIKLRREIQAELARIRKIAHYGNETYVRLFGEIFSPKGIDRHRLLGCVVYHGLIASTPPWEKKLRIDLPGDQSLMTFCRGKLEELKKMH